MRRTKRVRVRSSGGLLLACVTTAAACGGAAPPPPAPVARASSPADPNRRLDHEECVSLGQRMADACQTRPNERSARVDGWCNEILSGVSSGDWVTSECLAHIRYMDAACIHSATNVHAMMDCDSGVDRGAPPP
jgi:hypothetical protein